MGQHDDAAGRPLPGDAVGRQIAKVTTWCVRHAPLVVILTLVVTAGLGIGIKNTALDQELADGLPERNPNKRALDRVMDKLPGVSTLEAVLLELDPDKAYPLGVRDVRDQDAIRAIEYVYQYVLEEVPDLSGGVGLSHVVKQVRVVANNNDQSYFVLPGEDPLGRAEFDLLWGIANNTVRSNIELTIRNPDYQSTVLVLQYDAPLNSAESKAIGAAISRAMVAYREAVRSGEVPERYDIWKEEYVHNLGPQSGLAKFEAHLREELPILVPAAFLFIFMALWIGLRNPGTAVVGILGLVIACTATIGILGWLRIPFTSQNVSMIPLIVGTGIDYAIHVLNEYTEERTKGKGLEATFRVVGHRAGVAMVLATTTSVAGLLSMAFSSSVALTQLAFSASFALVTVTLLALTFLPAATALMADRLHVRFKPSTFMPRIYHAVNRRKVVAVVIFVAISGVLWANTANLSYFTDITSTNFPEDDPFIVAYERLKVRQQGSADELIIIEGDLTDPATLRYIRHIEEDLINNQTAFVESRAHVNSLTVLLGAYELLGNTLEGGPRFGESVLEALLRDPLNPQGAGTGADHVRASGPTDRSGIEAAIAAMKDNVAWRPLLDFLYSQDGTLTIINVLVNDGGTRDIETLRAINEAMWESIGRADAAGLRPEGLQVHVNGLSSGLYQFLDFSFTWIKILLLVSAVTGTTLMFLFTRSVRATLAFLTPMLFTTTWFFGLLPFFGIQVGAQMILPLIFITSIGSDYAAHLSWNILKTGHPHQVYRTTGKAILFSAITDFGAFFVFTFSYLKGGVANVAMATSLAILAIFVVTMLTVPLFFNREVDDRGGGGRAGGTSVTADAAGSAHA